MKQVVEKSCSQTVLAVSPRHGANTARHRRAWQANRQPGDCARRALVAASACLGADLFTLEACHENGFVLTGPLERYGFVVLTGEACGLMYRILFDLTAAGRNVAQKCFGVPDLRLAEKLGIGAMRPSGTSGRSCSRAQCLCRWPS